jgi:microcystin-dependent protein
LPRNGSGSYSLPEAAFVPNTAISSTAVNSDFSDIASALTGSLARDGQGGMTAVLPLANLGFTYLNDPNTGMRRTAADTQAISCGNVDVIEMTATTVNIPVALTVAGAPLLPIGMGSLWFGTAAPSKWVIANGQTLLRASYPDLWTFAAAEIALGNTLFTNGNGTTTFTVADLTGRIGAGKESVATRLTSTYFGGNSTILGATGGLESNTLTTAQLAAHSHGITDPGHAHVEQGSPAGGGSTSISKPNNATSGVDAPGSTQTSSAVTGITINNAGGGTAHNNVQPTIIVNYIIYAGV